MDLNKETIKIIQITDMHLFKNDTYLFNVNTNGAFKKIMSKIQHELIDTDAIFLTGDLSQDESTESYETIADSLKDFPGTIYWIPGNHDSIHKMQAVFCKKDNFSKGLTLYTALWDFIFLNSKKEGVDTGFLSHNEILLLRSELTEDRKKP